MKTTLEIALLTLTSIAVLSSPGVAASSDWMLRAHGIAATTLADSERIEDTELSTDGGLGVAVQLERRVGNRWGVEFGALRTDVDGKITLFGSPTGPIGDEATFDMTSLSLGAVLHLDSAERLDVTLAPLVAWSRYGDATFRAAGRSDFEATFEDEVSFGVRLGLDLGAGDWVFSANATFLRATAEVEGDAAGGLGLDPLLVGLGIGYRF